MNWGFYELLARTLLSSLLSGLVSLPSLHLFIRSALIHFNLIEKPRTDYISFGERKTICSIPYIVDINLSLALTLIDIVLYSCLFLVVRAAIKKCFSLLVLSSS